MDMNFNFQVDHSVELDVPGKLFAADAPVDQWLIAEIYADLAEEQARRRSAALQS